MTPTWGGGGAFLITLEAVTLFRSLQVPNQRLAYRFHKLPYKYEPGVTRSLRHGSRLNTCIQQHVPQAANSTHTGSLSSEFSPVSIPLGNSWPSGWQLIPMPSQPMLLYPGPMPSHPMLWYPGPMQSQPVAPVPIERVTPVIHRTTPDATSIAVSVIKRLNRENHSQGNSLGEPTNSPN